MNIERIRDVSTTTYPIRGILSTGAGTADLANYDGYKVSKYYLNFAKVKVVFEGVEGQFCWHSASLRLFKFTDGPSFIKMMEYTVDSVNMSTMNMFGIGGKGKVENSERRWFPIEVQINRDFFCDPSHAVKMKIEDIETETDLALEYYEEMKRKCDDV